MRPQTKRWARFNLRTISGLLSTTLTVLLPSMSAAGSVPDITRCADQHGNIVSCSGGRGGGYPVYAPPPGPTPEELRKKRENRDLSEATNDAWDKGVEAFEKGDWARAIEYFKEALEYSPDDPDLLNNLKRAQDSLALAQAEAAAKKSKEAVASPTAKEAKTKAGECFDKGCAPEPPSSNVVDLSKVGLRPAMPEWMTKDPRYIQLDKEMKVLEKQYNEKQEKLKRIDEKLARGEGNKNELIMESVNLKQGMSIDTSKEADVRKRMVDLSIQLENK